MDLKTLFFDAFASRPRPGATQILKPDLSPEVALYEGERLRSHLAATPSLELTKHDVRGPVSSNIWMLTPQAFLYFLPAFMQIFLESFGFVDLFPAALIKALTCPSPTDKSAIQGLLEILDQNQLPNVFSTDTVEGLRQQEADWSDSDFEVSLTTFHERFDQLTQAEGAAILAFLVAAQEAYSEEFFDNELEIAINRHWIRYQSPSSTDFLNM